MESYKICVNNEAESKEAQELFFELGYSWPGCVKYYNNIGSYTFIAAYPDEMLLRWRGDTDKELTLSQLHDLVVLKRNDVKDANYRSKSVLDGFYFKSSDGVFYFMFEGKWVRSTTNTDEGLEPITKGLDLISGADALRALADGKEVEFKDGAGKWENIKYHMNLDLSMFLAAPEWMMFRLKPQTVKVEIELPKPFEPKVGEWFYYLSAEHEDGYGSRIMHDDTPEYLMNLGVYRTEDEIKQVVEQLRKIKGAV
ncbi:hypothetical protein [Acinetobacter phage vB_AbaM_IME285]|nr:hypothetical protein [Acinetobacter phage vB_AbaM_IME285]